MLRDMNEGGRLEKLRIPVIVGPTGVGKTDLSLVLAEDFGCEIVSADSRQIYRELTIGTAKPSPRDLQRAPHHFINELTLDQEFSAGRFADEADARIKQILARNRWPLVVGGSTLYISALQKGLGNVPRVDPSVRKGISKRLTREGADALYRELEEVDPQAAATMDATKTQRLVRALEVIEATGKPISSFQKQQHTPRFSYRTVVLYRERAELYARINERTDLMLEAGLLAEVQSVLDAGFDPSLNALRTIGYREAIAHLKGDIDVGTMRDLIAQNTRRYAKRQLTWFRRFPEYDWLPADSDYEQIRHVLFPDENIPDSPAEAMD